MKDRQEDGLGGIQDRGVKAYTEVPWGEGVAAPTGCCLSARILGCSLGLKFSLKRPPSPSCSEEPPPRMESPGLVPPLRYPGMG